MPPLPFDIIKAEVERAMTRPLDATFRDFSPDALASASIAQVHAATLTSGEEVVVKVRRPNISARK